MGVLPESRQPRDVRLCRLSTYRSARTLWVIVVLGKNVLKGQKHNRDGKLLPFQGEYTHILVPRATPWADSFLAFQAVPTQGFHNFRNFYYSILDKTERNNRRVFDKTERKAA